MRKETKKCTMRPTKSNYNFIITLREILYIECVATHSLLSIDSTKFYLSRFAAITFSRRAFRENLTRAFNNPNREFDRSSNARLRWAASAPHRVTAPSARRDALAAYPIRTVLPCVRVRVCVCMCVCVRGGDVSGGGGGGRLHSVRRALAAMHMRLRVARTHATHAASPPLPCSHDDDDNGDNGDDDDDDNEPCIFTFRVNIRIRTRKHVEYVRSWYPICVIWLIFPTKKVHHAGREQLRARARMAASPVPIYRMIGSR